MKSDQFSSVSRRHFVVSAGLSLVEKARQSGASAKITTQTLRGNVSALIGSGGNIGVLTGPDGKLIIDSGYSESQKQIADALANVSGDPIKHLINTSGRLELHFSSVAGGRDSY